MKTWKNLIIEALTRDFSLEADGHRVNKPEYYYQLGFPIEFVDQFIKDIQSDGSIKGTIFTDGKPREITSRVIHNLDFLYGIANELGITYNSDGGGRGWQARDLVKLIKEKIQT